MDEGYELRLLFYSG